MKITNQTTVAISYKLSDTDGTILEQTAEGEPLVYLQGLEMMLPAVEEALEGKFPGNKIRVELKAADAFGEEDEALITKIRSKKLKNHSELFVGKEITVFEGENEVLKTITEIKDDFITLDGNHPFAGKDIIFDIEVIEVHKTTDEDIEKFLQQAWH